MWSLGGAPDARRAEADVYKTNIPGTRLASRLLTTLENEARKEGCFHLMLETGYRQLEAISFYERNGYQRRGPFGGYEYDPNSIFGKDLSNHSVHMQLCWPDRYCYKLSIELLR